MTPSIKAVAVTLARPNRRRHELQFGDGLRLRPTKFSVPRRRTLRCANCGLQAPSLNDKRRP